MIPRSVPSCRTRRRRRCDFAIKVPLVYTNVFIRTWTAFQKLGVQRHVDARACGTPRSASTSRSASATTSTRRDPAEPIVLHLSQGGVQARAAGARPASRRPRRAAATTPFETIERSIRDQLGRMLGGGGFDPARDILGITVNRWPHGYAYQYNSLSDDFWLNGGEQPCVVARRPFGRIAIANSDAGPTPTPTRPSITGTARCRSC